MIVRDLAKKLNIAEDVVLATLKTLKLRAKDGDQDLSAAVIGVVKGELEDKGLIPKQEEPEKKPVKKTVPKKKTEPAPEGDEVLDKKPSPKKQTAKPLPAKEQPKVIIVKASSRPHPQPQEQKHIAPQTETKPVVHTPAPEPVKAAAVPVAVADPQPEPKQPAPTLPNELAQFQETQPDGTKKTFVKKIVKKIVVKKVAPKEQPEFISVKPLAHHGKRRPDATPSQATEHTSEEHLQQAPDQTPVPVAKRDGPLKDIELKIPLTVGDFAFRIQEKTNVILKTLMGMGIFANINQNLGEDIARKLCQEFGFNLVQVKSEEDQLVFEHEKDQEDPALLKQRAPVVTFMGHVDHGKTSLIDRIRKTKVVDTEHGGITQHIAAYSVALEKGNITFLDTPGHAAFTAMRSRGAHITDLVVLVVAADEGIMPQTEEAIDHARAAGVPIVVALNKIDRPNADPDMVKKQLMEHDLMPEEWGGKTVVVPVSAITGQGIDALLEMILLESEILELKANPDKKAAGIVVEAHLSPGKGAVATLIVQSGTLKEGDIVVAGPYYCRVKAMFDDRQKHVKAAGPCKPVEILGLPAVPEAGEKFFVVEEERRAREVTTARQEKLKAERLRSTSKITLEDLLAQKKEGEVRELNVVLKADVQGSAGAIRDSLLKIPADNKEVAIRFVHIGVGAVNASDVILAHASKAIVIAFNVATNSDANEELQKVPVEVRRYNIIYDVVNDVRAALEGMLRPDVKRNFVARAEVLQVFNLSKSGIVAGCIIRKGKMRKQLDVDVMRGTTSVYTGKITTLKRFKDDVREVGEGFECGIAVGGFDGYEPGDIIEAFQIEHIARTL